VGSRSQAEGIEPFIKLHKFLEVIPLQKGIQKIQRILGPRLRGDVEMTRVSGVAARAMPDKKAEVQKKTVDT
jgi:hypothetical protein